ncbi:MAG: LLM class F420-dependent oxidoreductase [Acidimicrobiales bacterium]
MTDRRFKVGVQLHPQHCTMEQLRDAWTTADELRLDSIWTWDHFYPLYGEPYGDHFEGTTLLAAMAATTSRPMLGLMVGCNSYRNPELMADLHRTIDHISGGRVYLGIGSGWFERDYEEYGYDFGTAGGRLRRLDADLDRIKGRLAKLNPQPLGRLPILVGGSGEKVTLRIVAEKADAWNTFGPPDNWAKKNAILDDWCAKVGRDPSEIERTVCISPGDLDQVEPLLEAGATHIIVMLGQPFDFSGVEALLKLAG